MYKISTAFSLIVLSLLAFSSFSSEKCCRHPHDQLHCTTTPPVNLGNMATYEVGGFCTIGGGDVSVTFGPTTLSTPCSSGGHFLVEFDLTLILTHPLSLSLSQGAASHSCADVNNSRSSLPPPLISAPTTGATLTDSTPTISGNPGSAGAGNTVNISSSTGSSCSATVLASGAYSCDLSPALPEGGPYTITATQTDGVITSGATTISITILGTLVLDSGSYRFSNGSYAQHCLEYRNDPRYNSEGDATYWIDPDGPGGNPQIRALCDMSSLGGGWTLISNRRGNTSNIEACGSTLGEFFNAACGNVVNVGFSDSYSIGDTTVRSNIVSSDEWRFMQYDSIGNFDSDDAYIIDYGGGDLFLPSTGPQPVPYFETPVNSVCNINNLSCDTTNVFFIWVGDGWYNSSLCNGGQNTSTALRGNYGYCHNGLGAYLSSSLFGNRSGYDETKLWNYTPFQADAFQERIWVR